jgi:phytoene desaturase
MSTDVAVVGSGLGGLSAACTLAARGHKVTVFEKNNWLGGKACVLEAEGFRFDMGPTILTMPSVLRRIFAEAGGDLEDALDLVPLDPQWRCFFDDGARLDLVADVDDMAGSLDALAPGTGLGLGYRRFLELSRELHRLADDYFFWRPIGSFGDMLRQSSLPALLRDLLRMRFHSTVAGTVRKHLRDPRAAQMADHFTQYVGSSPYAAPAILCGIAHMQTAEGIWYPRGGIRAVPLALEALARELGVTFHTDMKVEHIACENGTATGVRTANGEMHAFDVVLSNCDTVRTHRELLGGESARQFQGRGPHRPACSGVVLYLGLDCACERLLHHCFVFSRDPEEEFDAIYGRGEPAPDPTCYLCAPGRTEPDVAPEGGEALYVLVHTPPLRSDHDWSRMFPTYRNTILKKLERTAGLSDLEQHIVFEGALTPVDIRDRYMTLDGAIYGLASHGRLQGTLKPSNRSPDVRRLYLGGGSANPGPGMPMALMSGWTAADTLDRDLGGEG